MQLAKLSKKRNFLVLKSSLILSLLFSLPAFPWGKTAHRIIGEYAYRKLNPVAKREVNKLIGNGQMPFASIWADEIKSDENWNNARPWHYINIKKGQKIKDIEIKKSNIIWAMLHFEDVLRSSKYNQKEKAQALKFLIHIYGDFHQPLHLAYFKDRGGTKKEVNFFGKKTNLHHLWDEEMIDFQKLSFTEWANSLGKISAQEEFAFKSGSILDWAEGIRSNLDSIYDFPKQIRYKYLYKHKVLLNKLLKQAGYRLAYTLNRAFLRKPVNRENKLIRKKINNF